MLEVMAHVSVVTLTVELLWLEPRNAPFNHAEYPPANPDWTVVTIAVSAPLAVKYPRKMRFPP